MGKDMQVHAHLNYLTLAPDVDGFTSCLVAISPTHFKHPPNKSFVRNRSLKDERLRITHISSVWGLYYS